MGPPRTRAAYPIRPRRAESRGTRRAASRRRASRGLPYTARLVMTRVSQLYDRSRPVFSFEFFPPKTDKGVDALFCTLAELAPLAPDFVSVTCPLDKPRRPLTFGLVARIKAELGIEAVAHLVTVDYSRAEIDAVLRQLRE